MQYCQYDIYIPLRFEGVSAVSRCPFSALPISPLNEHVQLSFCMSTDKVLRRLNLPSRIHHWHFDVSADWLQPLCCSGMSVAELTILGPSRCRSLQPAAYQGWTTMASLVSHRFSDTGIGVLNAPPLYTTNEHIRVSLYLPCRRVHILFQQDSVYFQ
jgi:hypothetical protein